MSSSYDPSIEQLRRESERTREALASTVGELRDKVGDTATELKTLVSPAHIKQEIKDYVRGERESFKKTLRRKAQENPLQLAAVGAAVAYPVWGLLRAIPTPLLLIGAGLFFTSSRGQQAAKEAKSKLDDAVQRGTEQVSDLAGAVRSDLEDRVVGARYAAEDMQDAATSAVGSVTKRARAAFHDATDAVKDAAGKVAGQTKAAAGAVTDSASDYAAAAKDRASDMQDRAWDMGANGRKSATDFVTENPLLVAGIAAAVGAFIAASIPESEAENRLFGAGSKKLKDKAREAAAQGIETAGDIVAEKAGSMASAAAQEGLDAAGVRRAMNTVADSVRSVAEKGMNSAMGENSRSSQQSERNPT
jgi:ElaB/YqjD/DUF883 family membrane-anchored ribosome-binding protein